MQEGHVITAPQKPDLKPIAGAPVSRPSKVLILSGEMGEGHNAAAAAITEAIAEVWPQCRVERFDTLELCGKSFSRVLSRGYAIQIRFVPLTYELIYDWLCRYARFAAVFKAGLRRLFGPRLKDYLKVHDADLVISTYPFGSAALDWLRRHDGPTVPSVTYVPAFHVHPVWAYSGIDQHYVMYDTAPEHACTAGFERTMHLGAPPVRSGFGVVSKLEARGRLGFDPDAFMLLVTGGAWGLGGIAEGVQALIAAGLDVQIIAVCGRSQSLLDQLRALHAPAERLHIYGYVDNMPELMSAADVVVTNGAGVTVLEALRTPRPVIAFQPLAGHGKAATDEMIRRDLALVAPTVDDLVAVVRKLISDELLIARMEHAGRHWTEGRDLRESVRQMEELFAPAAASSDAG